jgi:hypothetical protein
MRRFGGLKKNRFTASPAKEDRDTNRIRPNLISILIGQKGRR